MGTYQIGTESAGYRTSTKWLSIGKGSKGNNALLFVADDNRFGFEVSSSKETNITIDGYMQPFSTVNTEKIDSNKFLFTIVPISNFNEISNYTNIQYNIK